MKGCIFLQKVFLKNCVKGLLTAMLTSIALVFLFGWICNGAKDPAALAGVFGRTALYLGAFTGGVVSAKANREKGLVSGLATGGVFMLAVVILSLILRDGSQPISFMSWVMFFLVALISGVGGFIGVPSHKKKKRRKKKKQQK